MFIEPDSIAFEIKPGPYDAKLDKEFAPWSPREDAPEAADFVRWMETAGFTDVRARELASDREPGEARPADEDVVLPAQRGALVTALRRSNRHAGG